MSKTNEFMKRLGVRVSPYDERDLVYGIHPEVVVDVPESFSLESGMTSVKDQGSVQSCVAFACCSIVEYLFGSEKLDLSESFVYCGRMNSSPGMYPRDALKALMSVGVPPEWCHKYVDNPTKVCSEDFCEDYKDEAAKYRIASYHRVYSKLENALYGGSVPIFLVVPVYENWAGISKNGIVPYPGGNMIGYHALTLTGYDSRYFEAKNSWGTDDGKNGYFYLPKSYPIPEAWLLSIGVIDSVKVLEFSLGELGSIFGLPVRFTIKSTKSCTMTSFLNGKYFRRKRVREGLSEVKVNIPTEVGTSGLTLEFYKKRNEMIGIWKGTLDIKVGLKENE